MLAVTGWADSEGNERSSRSCKIDVFGIGCQGKPSAGGGIVGSRSVVTKDVEPYTVVAGVPAKPVRKRFDEETIQTLLEVKWWDLPDEAVEKLLPDLIQGNVDAFLEKAAAAWKK